MRRTAIVVSIICSIAVLAATSGVSATAAPQSSAGPVQLSVAEDVITDTIEVTFENGPGNRSDWIGIYKDGVSYSWSYLNGERTPPQSGITTGSITFTNLDLPDGTYRFEFRPNNGYRATAVQEHKIQPLLANYDAENQSVGFQFKNIQNSSGNAWAGLYKSGVTFNSWEDWSYMDGTKTRGRSVTAGQVSFSTEGLDAGRYRLRYYEIVSGKNVLTYTYDFSITDLEELMYLGFSTPNYEQMAAGDIDIIRESPYTAVASELRPAYSKTPVSAHNPQLPAASAKEVWPWVFLNRVVGSPDDGDFIFSSTSCHDGSGGDFSDLDAGIAIVGSNPHLDDFLRTYKIALTSAKASGAGGIVLDTELYNNSCAFRTFYLAEKMGKSEAEVIQHLRQFGSRLADITETAYSDAEILMLWNGLEIDYYGTIGHISAGFLDRSKAKNYSSTIIEGGQGQANFPQSSYFTCSPADSIRMNKERSDSYRDLSTNYPDRLTIGATLGLSTNPSAATGWVDAIYRDCENRNELAIRSVEDQLPTLRYLIDNHKFVWVYGAGHGPYNLFNQGQSEELNRLISEELASS